MIKITGKALIGEPEVLRTVGAAEIARLNADYTSDPDYASGKKKFIIDEKIYGDKEVKISLILAQHYKCCFCESRIGHIDYGDVEHFRPSARSQQVPGTPYIYPGYYWLAYSWNNLFLACATCNQGKKRSLFPLLNPGSRALSHNANLSLEQPVFIHLSDEDPEQYISFNHENVIAIGGNKRGAETIKYLNLDRSELTQTRKELLSKLTALYLIASNSLAQNLPLDIVQDSIEMLKEIYAEATNEQHQFVGMFRAFTRNYPIP